MQIKRKIPGVVFLLVMMGAFFFLVNHAVLKEQAYACSQSDEVACPSNLWWK